MLWQFRIIFMQKDNFNVIEFTLKTCAAHRIDFNAISCIYSFLIAIVQPCLYCTSAAASMLAAAINEKGNRDMIATA